MALAACAAACGGPTRDIKEGKVEDLLAGDSAAEDVPLASKAMKVERIALELEPQKDDYRIGANDVLNIIVLGHEEVSSARDFNRGIVGTVVKKDGKIYLPIVGPLEAAGYTVEEFHQVLVGHLKTYIVDPQVTVDVLEYESQKFYVLGEVHAPGAYPVDGDTKLLEALGMAKGVRPEGSLDRAYVVRDKALLPINLADLLLRGDTSRNIYMRNGDLVYVPSNDDQKVYVFGEVREPQAVRIPHGALSLAQALAEAGGLLPIEADEGSIKLVRGSWQEPTVYTLDYETVLALGDQIHLEPGDRVVVQPTGLTTASRYMQQILPFLQAADHGTAVYDRLKQ
jgi:polysaccharide export outer membrane protein